MKNTTKKLVKAGLVFCIAVLFVGSTATTLAYTTEKTSFVSSKTTAPLSDPSRDEIELKYYNEENLDNAIGLTGGSYPAKWKTAIRLSQDELAPYMDWTITKVVVAYAGDTDTIPEGMDITIYIYKENTPIRPGSVIVKDTTAHFDDQGVFTVPLVTPVPLATYQEIWVAIEWTQLVTDVFYAWMDTLTGPNVDNKSDWTYLGGWRKLHEDLPTADGRWGIGAIIEGEGGIAELAIGDVTGPIGVKSEVTNTGEKDASNVEWSIAVTGGLLKRINATDNGTAATLAPSGSIPVSVGMFLGFGKINIKITANAQNAAPVSTTKSAFVLGPFVIGIK